jgi:hypothetical protein
MVTTGAKYFFGITAFALLAAVVYAMSTYGDPLGMSAFLGSITFGYKGGVGDHAGYAVLVGLIAASALLGVVASAVRDADPKALAELAIGPEAPEEAAPAVKAPAGTNWWPALVAFGLAVVVVGLVTEAKVFIIGWVIVGLATLEWGVRAWADHATADSAINRTLRHRFMNPLELPGFAVIGIGIFVISVSRLLLATNEHVATFIFGAVPATILLVAVLINLRPQTSKAIIGGLLALGAAVVLAAGVTGLVRGEHHKEREAPKGTHFKPHLVGMAPVEPGAPVTVRVTA